MDGEDQVGHLCKKLENITGIQGGMEWPAYKVMEED